MDLELSNDNVAQARPPQITCFYDITSNDNVAQARPPQTTCFHDIISNDNVAPAGPLLKQLAFANLEVLMNHETALRPTPTVINAWTRRVRTCRLPLNFNWRLALRREIGIAAILSIFWHFMNFN